MVKQNKTKMPPVPLPPKIPAHKQASFESMPLHGEAADEEQREVDRIMMRQISQRRGMLQYSRAEFAKSVLVALLAGLVAGCIAFFALGTIGIYGLLQQAITAGAFLAASILTFGVTASR